MPHRDRPILIVDDNADDIVLTVRMLQRAHVANDVVIVKDGVGALDHLADCSRGHGSGESQLPALTFLDLRLPGLDGVEVLRRVRAHPATRDLPVAILTSESGDRDLVAAVPLGIHAFLRKPLQFEELVAVLSQLRLSLLLTDPLQPPPAAAAV